ncbi:hypothetical protein pb186bvf_017144 [Paramecium bursaria]
MAHDYKFSYLIILMFKYIDREDQQNYNKIKKFINFPSYIFFPQANSLSMISIFKVTFSEYLLLVARKQSSIISKNKQIYNFFQYHFFQSENSSRI